MDIETFKEHLTIIPDKQAYLFRQRYICSFIDIEMEHYKKYIQSLKKFTDGWCYTGYLWDCIKDPTVISFSEITNYKKILKEILVFWDIHSKERILVKDYWKFPKESMLKLNFDYLINNLSYLPEDIYIFDEELGWTLILTHEDINGERICIKSGRI